MSRPRWPTWRRDVSIFSGSAGGASIATFGFTHNWGAQQWGPLSGWVSGLLTVAAVSVALREAGQGRRDRQVDHELQRRRECIDALSGLWGAVMQAGLGIQALTSYIDELKPQFAPTGPTPARYGRAMARSPLGNITQVSINAAEEPSIADEYTSMYSELTNTWVTSVEPHVFRSLSLLEDTPLKGGVQDLMRDFNAIVNKELPKLTKSVLRGTRPSTDPLKAAWKAMAERRQGHLELVRQHFGLQLAEVETFTLRGGWWDPPLADPDEVEPPVPASGKRKTDSV